MIREENFVSESEIVRIRPANGWISLKLGELWEYRELLYFLIWRDIKVRYKQTALGASWAIIQPLMTMVVFSLFFGKLGKMPSDGIPYPVFSFTALVPWTFFVNGLTNGSNSMVGNANLIKKVYFPRLAIPISAVTSGVADLAVAFGVLLILMFYFGVFPNIEIIWLPAFVLLALATSLGVSLWLAAMNVQYRDIKYVLPFISQFWLFATPIAYPSSLLPKPWRPLFAINPMVGVVEGFRWALLGTSTAPGIMFAVSTCSAVTILISGAFYFRRMERTFADVV